ncbi:MAG: hypothetical protein ACTS73_03490 [Arsenophonus sp. NEOnobi-MAG3]
MDSVLENDKTSATEVMASIEKVFFLSNEAAINDIIVVAGSAPLLTFSYL